MNATHDADTLTWLRLQGQNLRARLAIVAGSIAQTEEDLAATLDRLALQRPRDAARLQARAEFARLYAATERERSTEYGAPPGWHATPASDARGESAGPEAASPVAK